MVRVVRICMFVIRIYVFTRTRKYEPRTGENEPRARVVRFILFVVRFFPVRRTGENEPRARVVRFLLFVVRLLLFVEQASRFAFSVVRIIVTPG